MLFEPLMLRRVALDHTCLGDMNLDCFKAREDIIIMFLFYRIQLELIRYENL